MNNKYYGYGLVAIVLIILVVVVHNSNSTPQNNTVTTTIATTTTTTTTTTTKPANTGTSGEQVTSPSAGATNGAKYYPIDKVYLSSNSDIYYKPSPSVAQSIVVNSPPLHSSIGSPLVVTGTAVGSWFFEGVFPVILTDKNGKIIAEGQAKALSNWQTTGMVPFTTTLTFSKQIGGISGVLILKNDNPSGIPANDQSIEIAVEF
jgi:hypothetical protein